MHCSQTRTGSQNITSVHQSDLPKCLGACSDRVGDGCVGVVFDQSMLGGFENCYLLNATGTANYPVNMTFAELRSNTGSETSGNDSSNSAWIAGPVVGVIAAVLLLAAGFWWFRRNRQRSRQMQQESVAYEKYSYPRPAEKSGISTSSYASELPQPLERPYELQDRNSERMYQHEMPS